MNGFTEGLWAIVDGVNEKVADLSPDDRAKIGRGYEVGHSFGIVTDVVTGKQLEVFQASCGGDYCNCAVTVKEVND